MHNKFEVFIIIGMTGSRKILSRQTKSKIFTYRLKYTDTAEDYTMFVNFPSCTTLPFCSSHLRAEMTVRK
jgi:hypothetical protein